jgi:hypothetical protein
MIFTEEKRRIIIESKISNWAIFLSMSPPITRQFVALDFKKTDKRKLPRATARMLRAFFVNTWISGLTFSNSGVSIMKQDTSFTQQNAEEKGRKLRVLSE